MKYSAGAWLVLGSLVVFPLAASAASDLNVTKEGIFTANNILVMQKGGTYNLFARATWGDMYVRLVILTHDTTVITKEHGEHAVADDIQEGHILDIKGKLVGGEGALTLDATTLVDHSLQVGFKALSGIVKSVDAPRRTIVVSSNGSGSATIIVGATTTIQKGARVIKIGDIATGDRILSASGPFDYPHNILNASIMEVYQDQSIFAPRNFEGTLKSVAGTSFPTSVVVHVGSTDYTFYLNTATSVLNKSRAPVSLSRFVIGDAVRLYGAVRKTDLTGVDAEVLRDLEF